MTMTPTEHKDDFMTTVDLEYPTTGIEPSIAVVPAYDGNAAYSAQEVGTASCPPPPMAYTTTAGIQSTDKQFSSSDKTACCLIGGSIACTGLIGCLCLLLPVIIFLVVFFQMKKNADQEFNSMHSFGTGYDNNFNKIYDDDFNKINFGEFDNGGRYLRGDQWENFYGPDY